MRALLACRGPALAALVALATVASCGLPREPLHDPATADAVRVLATDTLALFHDIDADPSGEGYPARAPAYRDLAVQAETIKLLSEARSFARRTTGAGQGVVSAIAGRVAAGIAPADLLAGAAPHATDYANATEGFMADYLRNLGDLEALDRDARVGHAAAEAAFHAAVEAHVAATEAYLAAWRRWDAGHGPKPEPVAPAPEAPNARDVSRLIALRRTALTDILRDALIYERDILDRTR